MTTPREEYIRRLTAHQARHARLEQQHILTGNLRLAVALLFVLQAWLTFGSGLIPPLWLLLPVAGFVTLAVVHERILRARRRAIRATSAYERGVARLEDRWVGTGRAGERFREAAHPYAEDLDLFGPGGLFELLSIARTRMGEWMVAHWLKVPSPLEAVRERHAAVAELRDNLDLREDLQILGEDVRVGVHPKALVDWAEEAPVLDSGALRTTAMALAALAVATVGMWIWLGWRVPFILVLAVEAGYVYRTRSKVRRVIAGVERASHDLALLSELLARLERERFTAARLAHLHAVLDGDGQPPSRQIARLNRLVELLDSRDNVAMRIIGPPLLYTTQLAFAAEAWRRRSGVRVRTWLEAVGEMEALCSLAGYAYEHPEDPFPEFTSAAACFDGEALSHPLLQSGRAVPNDVRLCGEPAVMVVSGSNMSGKSTLLRTVGLNAVLAMAGAPVRARSLRLSPLTVGASMRTIDSLQGGSSRFYAEITRLRKLADLAKGPHPLLFLLDELLHDTNSHDRRVGAEGIVRELAGRGAIGMVTTHDLALAHIADQMAPRGTNVHFEDHLEGGKISFDYKVRAGIAQKSNALELMRSIGLDV